MSTQSWRTWKQLIKILSKYINTKTYSDIFGFCFEPKACLARALKKYNTLFSYVSIDVSVGQRYVWVYLLYLNFADRPKRCLWLCVLWVHVKSDCVQVWTGTKSIESIKSIEENAVSQAAPPLPFHHLLQFLTGSTFAKLKVAKFNMMQI